MERDEYSYNVYAVRQKVSVIQTDLNDHLNKYIDKADRINKAYSDAVNDSFEDTYYRGFHGKEGNLNFFGDSAQRIKSLGKDIAEGFGYAWNATTIGAGSFADLTSETRDYFTASLAQPVFDRLPVEKQFSTIDNLLRTEKQIDDFYDTSYDYYQQNVAAVIQNTVQPVIQKYDKLQTNYSNFATEHPNIAEGIAAVGAIIDATPAGQGKKQPLNQARNIAEELEKNGTRGAEKVADSSNTTKKTKGEILRENNQKATIPYGTKIPPTDVEVIRHSASEFITHNYNKNKQK